MSYLLSHACQTGVRLTGNPRQVWMLELKNQRLTLLPYLSISWTQIPTHNSVLVSLPIKEVAECLGRLDWKSCWLHVVQLFAVTAVSQGFLQQWLMHFNAYLPQDKSSPVPTVYWRSRIHHHSHSCSFHSCVVCIYAFQSPMCAAPAQLGCYRSLHLALTSYR